MRPRMATPVRLFGGDFSFDADQECQNFFAEYLDLESSTTTKPATIYG